jgi:hypothetical protein
MGTAFSRIVPIENWSVYEAPLVISGLREVKQLRLTAQIEPERERNSSTHRQMQMLMLMLMLMLMQMHGGADVMTLGEAMPETLCKMGRKVWVWVLRLTLAPTKIKIKLHI